MRMITEKTAKNTLKNRTSESNAYIFTIYE